jgi:hypothetical protein
VSTGFYFGSYWGPWGWGAGYPYYGYPYYPYYPYNYPYPYYYGPSVTVQEEPQTYIEQDTRPEEPVYWYHCPDPEGYYPYVKKCPKGWQRVPATPPPDSEE